MVMRIESDFFDNGQDGFAYVVDAIEKAKSSIFIQMFIWRDDPLGQWIGKAVLEAADRGVKVEIVKDQVGGGFEFSEENRQSFFYETLPFKIRFMAFLLHLGYPMKGKPRGMVKRQMSPVAKALLSHKNLVVKHLDMIKDHSKYLIIDDELLIISGMNFEYKEWKEDLLGRPYHDYLISFKGKGIVDNFKKSLAQGGTILRHISSLDTGQPEEEMGHGDIDFICNSEDQGLKRFNIRDSLMNRISQGTYRLDIVMAYIGDKKLNEILEKKAEEGVEIHLYIPEKANLQNDLNRKYIKSLMKACKGQLFVYFCRDMIHGKLLVIDENYVTFGSANLNRNAMVLLKETNVGFFIDALGHREKIYQSIKKIMSRSRKVSDYREVSYNPLTALVEEILSRAK